MSERTGEIKTDVFFTLLDLHKIELQAKDIASMKKNYVNGDQIAYLEALASIRIDIIQAMIGDENWITSKNALPNQYQNYGKKLTAETLS